jgi:hypothetical protein
MPKRKSPGSVQSLDQRPEETAGNEGTNNNSLLQIKGGITQKLGYNSCFISRNMLTSTVCLTLMY